MVVAEMPPVLAVLEPLIKVTQVVTARLLLLAVEAVRVQQVVMPHPVKPAVTAVMVLRQQLQALPLPEVAEAEVVET